MSNRPYTWEKKNVDHSYDDIIHLSRPKSKKHPPMSMEACAAQFSPYDALTGYSDQIVETARITDGRVELSPEEQQMLDQQIALLIEKVDTAGKYGEKPTVRIVYFVPDKKKDGGRYDEVEGTVRLVDTVNRELVLAGAKPTDGVKIRLDDIVEIYGEVFDGAFDRVFSAAEQLAIVNSHTKTAPLQEMYFHIPHSGVLFSCRGLIYSTISSAFSSATPAPAPSIKAITSSILLPLAATAARSRF